MRDIMEFSREGGTSSSTNESVLYYKDESVRDPLTEFCPFTDTELTDKTVEAEIARIHLTYNTEIIDNPYSTLVAGAPRLAGDRYIITVRKSDYEFTFMIFDTVERSFRVVFTPDMLPIGNILIKGTTLLVTLREETSTTSVFQLKEAEYNILTDTWSTLSSIEYYTAPANEYPPTITTTHRILLGVFSTMQDDSALLEARAGSDTATINLLSSDSTDLQQLLTAGTTLFWFLELDAGGLCIAEIRNSGDGSNIDILQVYNDAGVVTQNNTVTSFSFARVQKERGGYNLPLVVIGGTTYFLSISTWTDRAVLIDANTLHKAKEIMNFTYVHSAVTSTEDRQEVYVWGGTDKVDALSLKTLKSDKPIHKIPTEAFREYTAKTVLTPYAIKPTIFH